MVESILHQGKNTNCKEDLDEFLLSLDSIPPTSVKQEVQIQPSAYEAMVSALPDNVQRILSVCSFTAEFTGDNGEELTFTESNVVAYIGGYIVRKLRGKVCENCMPKLIHDPAEQGVDDSHLVFIQMKKYAGAKDGLISPSKSLIDVLTAVEKQYRQTIDSVMYSEKVKATLVSKILKEVSLENLQCSCKSHIAIVHLMVNIRFHFSLKLANNSLKQDKGRKNRKVMKFAHL